VKYAILGAISFAMVGAGFCISAGLHHRDERGRVIKTEVGQRTEVRLDDGSVVALNTNSKITTQFTARERRVTLEWGEAQFTVSKDSRRPFVVEAPQADIIAVGTIFDVLATEADHTSVVVLEGKVQVLTRVPDARSMSKERSETFLRMNELATVTAEGKVIAGAGPPIERVSSWPGNLLVFTDEQLSTVVAEFNRYNRQPARIVDAELGKCTVTMMFGTNERHVFISYLKRFLGVRVEGNEEEGYWLYKNDASAGSPADCEPGAKPVPANSRFLRADD